MLPNNRVVCIGGGPAGLTAAYELGKQQCNALVLEADPDYVGGISRTIQRDGFCFDVGGHRFFSKSREVEALWQEILGDDLLTRSRKSRIFYGGKFYSYPLDLKETILNLGIIESGLCGLSYIKARLCPMPNPHTFEEWVSNQFGTRLFGTFFKTYTEKVWGMKCTEISADWAAQRIKGLSLSTAVKNALLRSLGIQSKNTIKTLIESFRYPRKGPGMLWEAAAKKIHTMGGEVHLGCRVQSLEWQADTQRWHITYADSKVGATQTVEAQHVISSMPLRELMGSIRGVPAEIMVAANKLHYRDFITVALVVNDRGSFDDNWIYIHDPDVMVGRIQNFKSWSPEMIPDAALTCYGMEYFCFEGDGRWNSSDEELVALATRELVAIKLAKQEDIIKGYVVRQPKAYPVYDQDYTHHVETLKRWLDAHCPNLQIVGRNGMHKYNNQDHSMMTAMLAAKNILLGRKEYDVWRINQDAEYNETESPEKGKPGSSGERLVPSAVDK